MNTFLKELCLTVSFFLAGLVLAVIFFVIFLVCILQSLYEGVEIKTRSWIDAKLS